MTESPEAPRARFCYQCGRRISREGDRCWYCDAAVRRTLRVPRRCQFCGEVVRREAVKCPHCHEYLDGRPQAAPPAQMVFIVDRALLHARQDVELLAGRPVPADVARALDAQTVRAIEENQPRLITQGGVRALPAPEGVIDIEAQPASRAVARRTDVSRAETSEDRGLARRTSIARRGIGGTLARWLAPRPARVPAPESPTKASGKINDETDVEAHDKFKICENCGTEMLRADNFCYYCGVQHHAPQNLHGGYVSQFERQGGNGGLFLLIVGLICLTWLREAGKLPFDIPFLYLILPGSAAFLCVVAFFRRRGFFSKLISIFLLIATLCIFIYQPMLPFMH